MVWVVWAAVEWVAVAIWVAVNSDLAVAVRVQWAGAAVVVDSTVLVIEAAAAAVVAEEALAREALAAAVADLIKTICN